MYVFLPNKKNLPCCPVNVPHSVGGLAPARLPPPGVIARLSLSQLPVVLVGWPSPVVTKSSLIWHISGMYIWLEWHVDWS